MDAGDYEAEEALKAGADLCVNGAGSSPGYIDRLAVALMRQTAM